MLLCDCDLNLQELDNNAQPELHGNLHWQIFHGIYEQKGKSSLTLYVITLLIWLLQTLSLMCSDLRLQFAVILTLFGSTV